MRIPGVTLGGYTYDNNVEVEFATYHFGGVAVVLYEDGEPLCTASVNMEVPPAPGCVWIKDWSENAGILESLTKAGIIAPTGRTTQAGYAVAHEARLLVDPEAEQ